MEPIVTNRFPIFAAWCYVIARRLGYREDEAKSLAVTRAKLGAAARAGLLGTGGKSSAHTPATGPGAPSARPPKEIDQVAFVGMRPFVTEEHGELRGVLRGGGIPREVPAVEYDRSVIRKLGEAYPAVLRELQKLAEALPPGELNARGYQLWEAFAPMVRDAGGRASRPRFGQRGVFDPAKVERLLTELSETRLPSAA